MGEPVAPLPDGPDAAASAPRPSPRRHPQPRAEPLDSPAPAEAIAAAVKDLPLVARQVPLAGTPHSELEAVASFLAETSEALYDPTRPWQVSEFTLHLDIPPIPDLPTSPFPSSPETETALQSEVDSLLAAGKITPVPGEISGSRVFAIPKGDGSLRAVVDYRKFNEHSPPLPAYTPLMDEIFRAVAGFAYASVLDCKDAFHAVRLSDTLSHAARFIAPSGIVYRPLVMLFGMTVSPAAFHQVMQQVLAPVITRHPDATIRYYVDDIVVATHGDADHHLTVLRDVMLTLATAHLTVNPKKLQLLRRSVRLLGFNVSPSGLTLCESRVEAILSMGQPKTKLHLQRALGVFNFVSRFIPDYAAITAPLVALTAKNARFQWGSDQESAWAQLLTATKKAPILAFYHPRLPVVLETDGSLLGVGAVLYQPTPTGETNFLGFWSKRLSEAQRRHWTAGESEFYAIHGGLRFARNIVGYVRIHVRTDPQNHQYLRSADLCNQHRR